MKTTLLAHFSTKRWIVSQVRMLMLVHWERERRENNIYLQKMRGRKNHVS
jgi:hypothetical protein